MKKTPSAWLRTTGLSIALMLLTASAHAESTPPKILYVGAVSINACQDAKVLADWYSRLGIETKEYDGGYYGKIETAAGTVAFAVHRKKADAPAKSSGSVSVVYRVDNFDSALASAKAKGLLPDKTEKDDYGQFATFHDPDGNEVTLWAK